MSARLLCLSTFCVSLATLLGAQTDRLLVVDFPFDDGQATAGPAGDAPDDGEIAGDPQPACGVAQGSLLLDGQDDYVVFPRRVNDLFERSDFTVSLYFHPVQQTARQTLLSRRPNCATDEAGFVVDYLPAQRQLEFLLVEDVDAQLDLRVDLPEDRCWYHLVFERVDNVVTVYIDGERAGRASSPNRINLTADGTNLQLGRSACPQSASNFGGFVDELRVYRGGLNPEDRKTLFVDPPDRIRPLAFPAVNEGEEVELEIPNTCATSFTWSPAETIVDGPTTASPTVSPSENTTYVVEMGFDESPCVAQDEVTLQIFGPNSFDCTEVLVPSAFTPDGLGPESNEALFISNAAALQTFDVFEIYDRWGNRVFQTAEPAGAWDGTYEGEPAMPGPYLWRAAFACNGEEIEATGTTMLIR